MTVHPEVHLPPTASCTLTAPAADITDIDGDRGDPPDALAAPLSTSFTTVDSAPYVTATTPGGNTTDVGTSIPVTITFSEPVTLAAGAFSLVCGATAVPTTSATLDQRTFAFAPAGDLTPGDSCIGTVDRTKVSDLDSVDPPDHPSSDHALSFTVDSPPALASTDPSDDSHGIPRDGPLRVTFTEDVSVTPASFSLFCNGSQVPFRLSGSGTSTVTVTPQDELPGTATCTLQVIAAQVHDVDTGDPPDTMGADVAVHFTTVDTVASVVSTTPADGDGSVSGDTTVTVTFNEPATADIGALALECPSGAARGFSLSGSGTAVWTLTPDPMLPAATVCRLAVTGSKVHDLDAVDPPDTMAADVTARFTVAANSPPSGLALSASSVAENQPSGTPVGAFSTIDPDPGDTFAYTLVAGAGDRDNGFFAIVGDELRTVAPSTSREGALPRSAYARPTPPVGSFEKTFPVTVTDVNEAPTDISLSTRQSRRTSRPAPASACWVPRTPTPARRTVRGRDSRLRRHVCRWDELRSLRGVARHHGTVRRRGEVLLPRVRAGHRQWQPGDVNGRALPRHRERRQRSPRRRRRQRLRRHRQHPRRAGRHRPPARARPLAVRPAPRATTPTPRVPTLSVCRRHHRDDRVVAALTRSTPTAPSATCPGSGTSARPTPSTYTVTDGLLTSTGTISVAIGADRVWLGPTVRQPRVATCRSTAPFTTPTPLNGAGGAG